MSRLVEIASPEEKRRWFILKAPVSQYSENTYEVVDTFIETSGPATQRLAKESQVRPSSTLVLVRTESTATMTPSVMPSTGVTLPDLITSR